MGRVQVLFILLSCFLHTLGQDASGYSCVMNCTFRHATAWAQVLSLNNPQKVLMNIVQGLPPAILPTNLPPSTSTDSLSRVCDVYDSYSGCLNLCPDDMFRENVIGTINGLQMICTKQRKEVSSNTMPCVQLFTTEIQKICRNENEQLVATTNQLQAIDRQTPAVNFVSLLQRLCESALAQSHCVVPLLQQKCGNSASDLLHKLMTASLGSVEKLIGNKRDMMPVQCKELFSVMVSDGNGGVTIVLPETTMIPPIVEPTDNASSANNLRQGQDESTIDKSSALYPLSIFVLLISCFISGFNLFL